MDKFGENCTLPVEVSASLDEDKEILEVYYNNSSDEMEIQLLSSMKLNVPHLFNQALSLQISR